MQPTIPKILTLDDGEHAQRLLASLEDSRDAHLIIKTHSERKTERDGRLADAIFDGHEAGSGTPKRERAEKINRRIQRWAPHFIKSTPTKKEEGQGRSVVVNDTHASNFGLKRSTITTPNMRDDPVIQEAISSARSDGIREGRAQAVAENVHLEKALKQLRGPKNDLEISIVNFERDKRSLGDLAHKVNANTITSEVAAKLALDIINPEELADFINDLRAVKTEISRRLRSITLMDNTNELEKTQTKIQSLLSDCESVSAALLKIRPAGLKTFNATEIGTLIKTTEDGLSDFKRNNPNVEKGLKDAVAGDDNTILVRILKSGLYPIYFDLKDYIKGYKTFLLLSPNTRPFIEFIDNDQKHIRDGFWAAVSQLQNPNQNIRMHPDVARRVSGLSSDDRHRLLALADLMELSREIKSIYSFTKINELAKNLPKRQKPKNNDRQRAERTTPYKRRNHAAYDNNPNSPTVSNTLAIGFDPATAIRKAEEGLAQLGENDI